MVHKSTLTHCPHLSWHWKETANYNTKFCILHGRTVNFTPSIINAECMPCTNSHRQLSEQFQILIWTLKFLCLISPVQVAHQSPPRLRRSIINNQRFDIKQAERWLDINKQRVCVFQTQAMEPKSFSEKAPSELAVNKQCGCLHSLTLP